MIFKTMLLTFLYAISFFFSKENLNAQAPNLGSVSSFGVFTAVGAFNNTGSTFIVGDAGTNVGAYNGSPTLTGQSHVADATSVSAATDVASAYSDLFSLTCDSVIGSTLGSNQTLTPNIYCIGAATSLTGNLYLDAQNDSTAIFIFQIDGAFSAANFSNIILINKASSCQLYWQINGAVDIGDSSDFKGIIIANGAISMYNGASLEGKALSIAGAISLSNNTVNSCKQTLIALPVSIFSFDVKKIIVGQFNTLEWLCTNQFGTTEYIIERSNDGMKYNKIGAITAPYHQGQLDNFEFVDYHPLNGENYYRLKQIDSYGKIEYSRTIIASNSGFDIGVSLYPNPCSDKLVVIINTLTYFDKYQFKLYNLWGIEVMNVILKENTTALEIEKMSGGLYTYNLSNADDIIIIGKLVKM